MKTELPEQSYRNKNTGDVWNQPAWIANNLKNGVVGRSAHLVLVKSLTPVSERRIHVDESSPGLISFHVDNNIALEIEGNFSALIEFIFNIQKFDGVGEIFPLASKSDPP